MKPIDWVRQMIDHPMPAEAPPVSRWLDFVLKAVEPGYTKAHFRVREDMLNPLGLLHGGVQAALLDELMGMTVSLLDKALPSVSLHLHVDFLGKATANDILEAEVRVVRQGKQLVHVEAVLRHMDNRLVAKASSNLLNVML